MSSYPRGNRQTSFATVGDVISYWSDRTPDAPALLGSDGRSLSFAQLLYNAWSVSDVLSSRGIHRRDRVALCLRNGLSAATWTLSVMHYATAAPLNPLAHPESLRRSLALLGPRALVVDDPSSDLARVGQEMGIEVLSISQFPLEGGRSRRATLAPRSPQATALLVATSGTTTGEPKIARLSHRLLCAGSERVVKSLRLTQSDRCLNMMPLFHNHGLSGAVLASLIAGGSALCARGFEADSVRRWFERFAPTWYTAAPPIHHDMVELVRSDPRAVKLSRLRVIRSISAGLDRRVHVELERMFQIPVIEAWGFTEAGGQITSNGLANSARRIGTVGRASPPFEVRIVDGEELGNAKIGHVQIKTTDGVARYLDGTQIRRDGEWIDSGDLGSLDRDGYLTIHGRTADIANVGGEKVFLKEVQEVLMSFERVADVAVVTLPSARKGDVIGALVVSTDDTLDVASIRRYLSSRLDPFKLPERIALHNEVPKSPTGKVIRTDVVDVLSREGSDLETRLSPTPDSNPLETALAAIWSHALGCVVNADDDFLTLGGDSITAARVASAVRDAFAVDIAIEDVLRADSTVRGMAAIIRSFRG